MFWRHLPSLCDADSRQNQVVGDGPVPGDQGVAEARVGSVGFYGGMDRTEPGGCVNDHRSWRDLIADNPGHSSWYVERFRTLAAQGDDLAGEARFIDAMAPRGGRILDAGCGPGRVGGVLHALDHEVVGVDLDPVLIEAAHQDWPGPTWLVGDLAHLDLPTQGITDGFDVIVCAGNVMAFVEADARVLVLRRLGSHLRDGGRLAVGFGADRGYPFDAFRSDVVEAGLVSDLELSSWDVRPWTPESDWLLSILRNP